MVTDDFEQPVSRVLDGDIEAYRAIVDRCSPRMRIVVAAMLLDRTQVDDVVQDAFLVAYGKLREYSPGSDFMAWMVTIARNLALNARRQQLRRCHIEAKLVERIEEVCCPSHHAVRDDEIIEQLQDCVGRLDQVSRGLLERYYYHGDTIADIAHAEGQEVNQVEVALHRVRQQLADCLRRKGFRHG
jgi:RNA polymerase sigma-70 factor (ECF subfamily)